MRLDVWPGACATIPEHDVLLHAVSAAGKPHSWAHGSFADCKWQCNEGSQYLDAAAFVAACTSAGWLWLQHAAQVWALLQ